MYQSSIVAALTAIFGIASATSLAVSPRPTRSFSAGTVIGMSTKVVSATSTATAYNYLGIPFAAVPTGTLRFQPPKTAVSLSAPLQATSFPPACLQHFGIGSTANQAAGDLGPPDSEDCLYLNIFGPTGASRTNKKAVMFWIYGGNLAYGTASTRFYNGSSFAAFQDVIVVTFNYRTNIFGFSNSPQIALKQRNAGFLDQRAALFWTKSNIAQFGGDPDQITIFGESAGGYSVKQLLANPPSPLPYRAAIIESQALQLFGNSTANYEQVANHFGCTNGTTQLECLQKVSGTDIVQYLSTQSHLDFLPVKDNCTQSNDVRVDIRSKRWANVPFFLGNNADEGRSFVDGVGLDPAGNTTLREALQILFPNQTQFYHAVIAAYKPYEASVGNNVYLVASRIFTDFVFTCQAATIANLTAEHGYPTWRYYYNTSYPDLAYFPNPGAFHGSEIPQVFGTYPLKSPLGNATVDQEMLSNYMQTTWAGFAKNPARGPGDWPKWNSTGMRNSLADLGGVNATGEANINPMLADSFCPVFAPFYAVSGV